MNQKLFSMRWDIDHRACITDGLPAIMQVCDEVGVANTFFVNMGMSTNLREWIGKGFSGTRAKLTDMESINLIQKIGWGRFVYETLRARPVGLSCIDELQELVGAGHELGLHGGSDHVVWSRKFSETPEDVIRADVEETLSAYKSYFGNPTGFTSPGFKSDERVMALVEDLGFKYNGDAINGSPEKARARGEELGHWTIPVTVCGPRTIPFIEWLAAQGEDDEQILRRFEEQIADDQLVVLYGHPCYEGLKTDLLRKILIRVQELGFEVLTHEQLAGKLSSDSGNLH